MSIWRPWSRSRTPLPSPPNTCLASVSIFFCEKVSLAPYDQRVAEQKQQIEHVQKVAVARELEQQLTDGATELEMLIDVVSNLKIDDATQRTQIIDTISAIFANLNQARASLKKRTQELMAVEGAAEFHAQLKLLSQGVVNYLDVCDTPEKCDEYLTKMMVQIEELEGKFAEFDEFILQLSEKREEVYSAFDSRKSRTDRGQEQTRHGIAERGRPHLERNWNSRQ